MADKPVLKITEFEGEFCIDYQLVRLLEEKNMEEEIIRWHEKVREIWAKRNWDYDPSFGGYKWIEVDDPEKYVDEFYMIRDNKMKVSFDDLHFGLKREEELAVIEEMMSAAQEFVEFA